MKEEGKISRKKFLTGSVAVIFSALLGKTTGNAYSEEQLQNDDSSALEKDWEKLPIEVLAGAHLIFDPASPFFGGSTEARDCTLSQYFHVYPGLELMLSYTNESAERNGWIGYNKELQPIAILRNEKKYKGNEIREVVTIPSGVYYIRGSCSTRKGKPCAWVRNFAQYALYSNLNKPDVSLYTEITELNINQYSRLNEGGNFDTYSQGYPSIGDVFFAPIGTDIILTFNTANIAPYIHSGDNYTEMIKKEIFDRHYGFGYSWYHCTTTDVCNSLGASYETVNGCAIQLTLRELQAAEPHLYIRFQGRVTNTQTAAKNRTKGVSKNYQRLFSVVHVTDTHGDADTTYAVYKYADQIGANFIALTGDYVPYGPYHGYNILHSIVKHAKTPTVCTIGNHDVSGISDQDVFSTCLAPIKDSIQASDEHAYYYRDFLYNDITVRAISLYPFSDNSESHMYGYYSKEQLFWLCNTMASVPEGGHIFILRHFSHHKPLYLDDNQAMFYDLADSDTDAQNLWLDMGGDPIKDIVDAYNKREQIFAQYTGYLKKGKELISLKYDFTNRPNSEFVAYFTGHIHVDAMGYARNTKTKQVVLCSLCTTGVKGTEDYSYTSLTSPRDYGTDSQIALNLFSFDFEKKKIYVSRVGNGNHYNREKTWMELSYSI